MRNSLVLFFSLLLASAFSQQNFNIESCLSIAPNSNVLVAEISTRSDSLVGLYLNIYDSHKRLQEVIRLPDAGHKMETKIVLSNIVFGYYSYTITQKDVVLAKGEFNKDLYDALE